MKMEYPMKKVLIVAYAFPPVGGGGVQRPTKFVKYLREFDWEPVVITVANPSVPLTDKALCKDIPDNLSVYLAHTLEPSYTNKQSFTVKCYGIKACVRKILRTITSLIMVPDVQVLWWPGLVYKLFSAIRRERPTCIFVTAPPFSCLIPTVVIGRLFNLPVVVDVRDEWSFSRKNWGNATSIKLAIVIEKILERYAVTHCTAITSVNGSYIDAICTSYRSVDREKCTVVTNGFDTEDFTEKKVIEKLEQDNRIQIVYLGTIWNGNSLKPFVSALKKSLDKKPNLKNILKIKLFGRVVDTELEYLQFDDLAGIVNLFGYLQHDEAVHEMLKADILLLVISDLPGAENIIVGKVFEYMATGKHILAIVPEGETSRLLKDNYGNVTIIHPLDENSLMLFLMELPKTIDKLKEMIGMDVSCFSRRVLAGRLAGVFNKISEHEKAS
jgi:glycosyltransferase involved in cell wall biosynthesis